MIFAISQIIAETVTCCHLVVWHCQNARIPHAKLLTANFSHFQGRSLIGKDQCARLVKSWHTAAEDRRSISVMLFRHDFDPNTMYVYIYMCESCIRGLLGTVCRYLGQSHVLDVYEAKKALLSPKRTIPRPCLRICSPPGQVWFSGWVRLYLWILVSPKSTIFSSTKLIAPLAAIT